MYAFSNGNWRLHSQKAVRENVKKLAGILRSQEVLGRKRSRQGIPKRSQKKAVP